MWFMGWLGEEMGERKTIGVAMIGHAFMGAVHTQAWATASRAFGLAAVPAMRALAGRDHEATRAAAERLGWLSATNDWESLLDRPDIDVFDICTPSDSHAEIAIAALEAGKHVICEKPLANTVEEAERMALAAERARERGVRSMVGFNYRRIPAIALAHELIAAGRLGRIYQVRAGYLQDWASDPGLPLVWRMQRSRAGSGALGDLGAHIVDLAQYLLADQIVGVAGLTETFLRERPLEEGDGIGTVDVDDCAAFSARFCTGAIGTFEATRFALGRKNALHIEIYGELGSLTFDLERLNELWFYSRLDGSEGGFRRILVTEPDHPYLAAWWPAGHVLGWEHTFTHQIADFVTAIMGGTDPEPSFAAGLQVQRVLDAVGGSAKSESRWTSVETLASNLADPER
jgi:predicted dehydrogenase